MSARTERFICTSAGSVLLQLVVAYILWSQSRIKDGPDPQFGFLLILLALAGAALLCALDSMRRVSIWQRIVAGTLALFPVLFFAALFYDLVHTLFQS
jgi:hypothetical protein